MLYCTLERRLVAMLQLGAYDVELNLNGEECQLLSMNNQTGCAIQPQAKHPWSSTYHTAGSESGLRKATKSAQTV